MIFDWDDKKNASNLRKHGVRFENAVGVFEDPFYVSVREREVGGEERWQTIGIVDGVVLLVAHTMDLDEGEEFVRVISARRARPYERKRYEENE